MDKLPELLRRGSCRGEKHTIKGWDDVYAVRRKDGVTGYNCLGCRVDDRLKARSVFQRPARTNPAGTTIGRMIKGVCTVHGRDDIYQTKDTKGDNIYLRDRCRVCSRVKQTNDANASGENVRLVDSYSPAYVGIVGKGLAENDKKKGNLAGYRLVEIDLVCSHKTYYQRKHMPHFTEQLWCSGCRSFQLQERARKKVHDETPRATEVG